jgi:hypothetical protein
MRFKKKKTPHHVQTGTGVSLHNTVTNYDKFGNVHITYVLAEHEDVNLQGSE